MRGAAIILLNFLLLALLSPLLQRIGMAHYVPDVVLMSCVYVALTTNFDKAIGLALLLGLLKDGFMAGQAIGLSMLIFVIAVLLAGRLSRRLVLRGPVGVMLLSFGASLMSSILEIILSLLFVRTFTDGISGPGLIAAAMFPQALFTAPFGAVMFWLLDRLDALTTRKGESVFM